MRCEERIAYFELFVDQSVADGINIVFFPETFSNFLRVAALARESGKSVFGSSQRRGKLGVTVDY